MEDCKGPQARPGHRELRVFRELPNQMSGGRYYIPPGRRLCACGFAIFGGSGGWIASWAGFVPYQ